MRKFGFFGVALSALALNACGGGGSSDTELAAPQALEETPTIGQALNDEPQAIGFATPLSLEGKEVRLVAVDGDTYRIEGAGLGVAHAASVELNFEDERNQVGFFSHAEGRGDDVGLALALATTGEHPGSAESAGYAAWGYWQRSAFNSFNRETYLADAGAVYGGVRTPEGRVPTIGAAAYAGDAVAIERSLVEINGLDFETTPALLSGPATGEADFAAGTVTFALDLGKTGEAWGKVITDPMRIDGASFAGGATSTLAGGAAGPSGSLEGAFFGPDAREAAGAFELDDGSTRVAGSFGGVKRP